MTLHVEKGSLFDPVWGFSALGQGVNCLGVMGAGIAVPFKTRYPLMFSEYETLCKKYNRILPGYTQYSVEDNVEIGVEEVYNLFTQYYPGRGNADIYHVERSVFHLLQLAESAREYPEDYSVGLPWIGCGIGGLEKHNVYHLMKEYLAPSKVEFYIIEREEDA